MLRGREGRKDRRTEGGTLGSFLIRKEGGAGLPHRLAVLKSGWLQDAWGRSLCRGAKLKESGRGKDLGPVW